MDFVRKLGKGERTVDGAEVKGQSADVKWAGEYSAEGEVDDVGYWGQLEKEWEELSKYVVPSTSL